MKSRAPEVAAMIVVRGHRICALYDVTSEAVAAADTIVSIGDPADPVPREIASSGKRCLSLRFFDYDYEDAEAPQLRDARELIAFASQITPAEKLRVHCHAGISRSTAALAVILAVQHPELAYDVIFETVYAIRPEAWPNKRIIAHADRLLRAEGQFSMALQRFYLRHLDS
jgi:predicted protein tyrosine phosphatase